MTWASIQTDHYMSAKRFVGYALFFACLILVINFGLRASMGFFLKPVSETHHYGREIFAMSLALQNLFWGLFQPLFGAVADKFGVVKTIIVGAILYALGLYITSIAGSPMLLHTGAGLLVGMGIAATGFGVVLPAMARLVSPEKRSMALGLGTAAGSAGQFLVIPVAKEFIVAYGWQSALVIMALGALSMILFSPALAGRPGQQGAVTLADDSQTLSQALKEASSHVHYWLLIAGFFVCGFQLAFITVHMPSYLSDRRYQPGADRFFQYYRLADLGRPGRTVFQKMDIVLYLRFPRGSDRSISAGAHDHHEHLPVLNRHWNAVAGHHSAHLWHGGADVRA